MGNPTDRSAVLGGGNRLAAFDGYSLTYDLDGNLTRKRLTASSSQFDQHLTWNPVGQLTQVATTRQGVTTTVGYGYDGLGRRVRTTNPDGTVTSVLYDGDDLLLELAGDGSVRAKYMYYPGIDYPHSVVRGTQTAYFATDQVGSVSALFDSAGQVLNQYTYEPFGEMETVSEQVVNPLRFTAREYEATTNLYYYRNRWYDPHLGRFISEDPIGLEGGINAYAYVGNNPINYGDPMGLICQAYTTTGWYRRYRYGQLEFERKEWESTQFVGDCFNEVVDVFDRGGRNVRDEGPVLGAFICVTTIGGAYFSARDRRAKAERHSRAQREYAAARSRAQYLNEQWSSHIRWGRPAEARQAESAYGEVQREATRLYRVLQDAREDLNNGNGLMAFSGAGAAGVCLAAALAPTL